MAAAAEQSIQQSIAEAKADVREAKEQLQGATGDKEVALQQRLAALEQRLATLEQQKLLLMQQQSAAVGAAAGVSQTGSLLEGSLYADVLLERGSSQCQASLLVDTGCDLELNLSEYKANQLGLAPDGATAEVEMGQGHSGQLVRRGAVLTTLLLEGEEEDLVKDPRRSKYLEVWSDAGTRGGSSSSSSAASSAPGSSRPSSTDEAVASPMLKIKLLSPIREGKDSHGYDAILGAPGMAALSLGIDRDTMRLYRKQTPRHFRKLVKQQK